MKHTLSRRSLIALSITVVGSGSLFSGLAKAEEARPSPVIGLPTRSLGKPDAPHVVSEWFSLTCTHCAAFQKTVFPEIKKNLIDTGQLLYVFEDFPLDKIALSAALIARSMPEETYLPFIETLLETQNQWAFSPDAEQALIRQAKFAGMSEQSIKNAMNNDAMKTAIMSGQERASKNEISSTPTFVFGNGEKSVGEISYKEFCKKAGIKTN